MLTIAIALGYPAGTRDPILDADRASLVTSVLLRLTQIDSALTAGSVDGMAIKVGDITVDYLRQRYLLLAEGSRLLADLSRLSGMGIAYDRYRGVLGTVNRLYQVDAGYLG